MKKNLLFLFIICNIQVFAQTKQSCCSVSSTEKFATLASNEKFASAHLDPLPFNFLPTKGAMINYKTPDGKKANAFLVKSENPTDNWIIMIHEWWGLNNYIKEQAEILQSEIGLVNVMAIDLYDGAVATKSDEAKVLMSGMKVARVDSIIKGAIKFAGPNAKIYSIGWCMGGGWSLQTALMAGQQGAGCVMYYGMPETDLNKLNNLSGDVLMIFAKKDQWINSTIVTQFENDMKSLNKNLTVKGYVADHAFANPSNPNYDRIAGDDAHKNVLTFLKERMK